MQKKLYLMQELTLKAFFDCSKELREAAFKMSPDDVKAHTAEILELANINELVEGEKLRLEVDINGVAHIPIAGMLTNTVSPSAGFFGESITTYAFLSEAISQAEEITAIKEIVFEIASGGGEVDGLEVVANAIFNTKKPTSARVHGMAASAAFWLASQTDKIVAVGRTSSVGSIGVAAEFIDRSVQDKASGIKRVILTSTDAPKKRLDITTDAGQKQTVNRLDEMHTVFVDHIVRGMESRNKNITSDFVNKNFGNGSVMAADAALKIGMIDSIEGSETSTNNAGVAMVASTDSKPGEAPAITAQNEENMTLAEFLKANPTAQTEVDQMVAAGVETAEAESKDLFAKVSPIISSDAYPETVKQIGMKVLSGDRPLWALTDRVEELDAEAEAKKTADIIADPPEKTPAEIAALDEDGQAKETAEAQALGEKLGTAKKEK